MGQRRLGNVQGDDQNKRPQQGQKKSNNSVLNNTTIRKGEVFRAQRRTSENVQRVSNQHVINVPVNKSRLNGLGGEQFSPLMPAKNPKPFGNEPTLKVYALGGLGESSIGANMMAIEYGDDIITIDMGMLFADDTLPGINYFTPDVTYLQERKDKIRGHIFTHGHLDHIGSFKHLIDKIPAPVYSTKFTIAMLEKNVSENIHGFQPDFNILNPEKHERVRLGDSFEVELVRVNHSIPDAAAVVIRTPCGVLIHSGDWRFEKKPLDGLKLDMDRFEEISKNEGVLLLMNESTGCWVKGSHEKEEVEVGENLGEILVNNPGRRVIFSTFSSQIHRMQVIMEHAKKHNRKVAIAGYSMIQNLELAIKAGVIKIPSDTIVKMETASQMPRGEVVLICTGSQGDANAVLARMAVGNHKHIKLDREDVVVFSSSTVPGNNKPVIRTVDGLMREGSDVLQDSTAHLYDTGFLHTGGHGYHDDNVYFVTKIKPKYYMPIHGEFHMLALNGKMAVESCSIPAENVFVSDDGDVHEFTKDGRGKRTRRIHVGKTMYDSNADEVSDVVLRDRIHMANEGMFIVVLTVQRGSGRLLTSPDIISRGFIYMRDNEELMNTIRQYLKQKVARSFGKKTDMDVIKKELRDELTHILYDQTRRTPIVIPVINEIGGGQNSAQQNNRPTQRFNQPQSDQAKRQQPRQFPRPQVPDSEVTTPRR